MKLLNAILVAAIFLLAPAAEARFLRGAPFTQIFYNIVTDSGNPNSCTQTGGGVQVNVNATMAPGSGNITVFSNTFVSGDVGKFVIIPAANLGNNYRTIQSVGAWNGSQQTITLSGNVFATVTNAPISITYGFDDSPDFKTFNTWARANQGSSNQVVLTIPPGKTCWFGSSQTIAGNLNNSYFAGINNLIVEATGATISNQLGFGFYLAGNGVIEQGLGSASGKTARLKDIAPSTQTVELTSTSYAAGYISRFTVGDWLMISGMDIQTGYNENYGVPPNHQFFEWRQITSICNNTGPCSGTATITLDRPLTKTYLSTWPEYYAGTTNQIDQGGPATAYILPSSWNTTVEWRGVTVDSSGQTYAWGRNVTFRNVTWAGCCGTVPSQNESFAAINASYGGGTGWEVDKLVGSVTITGGSFNRIDFQSSSVDSLTMTNATIGSMFGTPKSAAITDTSIGTFRPGAWTNGASTGALVCTRCNVTTFQWPDQGLVQTYGAGYSKSSGVITIANATDTGGNGPPHRVFVPGANIYYRMNSVVETIGLYQGGAQTQDPTNVYVATSDAGGFPTYASYANQMVTHGAPQFTCNACTGDVTLVATNTQKGATPLAPLGEFSSYDNISPTTVGNFGKMWVRGKISSLSINVTTAYTGTGSPTLYAAGQFGLNTVKQSDWSTFSWNPNINIKQTGARVYTYPTGWTCNGSPGGCAGDSLGTDPPEQVWIGSGMNFGLSANLSGGVNPVLTVTARTSQGVVP